MSVVELDGDFSGKRAPVGVACLESPHEIRQGTGDEKILLHETQSLPPARRVVGIQDPRQRFGFERLGQRADEIAAAEFLKVEVIVGCGGPEPERIDGLAAEAHHGTIEGNADQTGRLTEDRAQVATPYGKRTVELHFHRLTRSNNLPWIRTTQPVIRDFALPAVLNRLLEDAVFVAQAVTHGGNLHRCHRVKEASGEAPEPAVTQARIGFLLQQLEPIELLLLDRFLRDRIEEKVGHVVGE